MTRSQWGFIVFFVSLPFIALFILTLAMPGYMMNFYDDSYWTYAPINLVQLGGVKLIFLNFAFRFNNRKKVNSKKLQKIDYRDIIIGILSVILFTLPSIWLVLIYPRIVIGFRLGV